MRLTDLVRVLEGRVHKNTIMIRLRELRKTHTVSYNEQLKRYQLTDISWETIRQLAILEIIRDSEQLVHIPYVGSDFGFPNTFVKVDRQDKLKGLMYRKICEKKAKDFPDNWIRDILFSAKDESLIDAEYLDGKRGFDELPNDILDKVCRKILPASGKMLYVEMIDIREFADFLRSPLGKARMKYVITRDEADERRYFDLYHQLRKERQVI